MDFSQLIYYSTTELHCSKIKDPWICSLSAVVPIFILEIRVIFFCEFQKSLQFIKYELTITQ